MYTTMLLTRCIKVNALFRFELGLFNGILMSAPRGLSFLPCPKFQLTIDERLTRSSPFSVWSIFFLSPSQRKTNSVCILSKGAKTDITTPLTLHSVARVGRPVSSRRCVFPLFLWPYTKGCLHVRVLQTDARVGHPIVATPAFLPVLDTTLIAFRVPPMGMGVAADDLGAWLAGKGEGWRGLCRNPKTNTCSFIETPIHIIRSYILYV